LNSVVGPLSFIIDSFGVNARETKTTGRRTHQTNA
jgi:hypothetical protein